eukprot:6315564-Amphidinium_carterae.2
MHKDCAARTKRPKLFRSSRAGGDTYCGHQHPKKAIGKASSSVGEFSLLCQRDTHILADSWHGRILWPHIQCSLRQEIQVNTPFPRISCFPLMPFALQRCTVAAHVRLEGATEENNEQWERDHLKACRSQNSLLESWHKDFPKTCFAGTFPET